MPCSHCPHCVQGLAVEGPWGDLPNEIAKRVVPEPNSGCWLWLGRTALGYGEINRRDYREYVHRAVFRHFHGALPPGHVHHKCGVRLCCNPAHLELLSASEHMRVTSTNRHKRRVA